MKSSFFSERKAATALIGVTAAFLVIAVLFPLLEVLVRSLSDKRGGFSGLSNYRAFFSNPVMYRAFANSLFVSCITMVISVSAGFVFAYAVTRSTIPGKAVFMTIAMAPLFSPTMMNGIALIYLFGNKGLVTTGFFGTVEKLIGLPFHFNIGIYGPVGIIIAEVVYTFPQVVLILTVALSNADARLYEASHSLGSGRIRTFLQVTLPSVRYGLASAASVAFILCFTDFGAPKVVGGNYAVLATDIYKQVIGQQNMAIGSTISIVLLVPTLLAFWADRAVQKRQASLITAKSVPLVPKPSRKRDGVFFVFGLLTSASILVLLLTVLLASLVKVWPYDLSLVLSHYDFVSVGGGGLASFRNSIEVSLASAIFGTVLTFLGAYAVEKIDPLPKLRQAAHFLSLLPLALPGLIIGLAYIFFFNKPEFSFGPVSFANPFVFLYGTFAILVISNIVHFYSVGYLASSTALKKIDREFELVSKSLSVPFYTTFRRVTLPLCFPALLEVATYFFVNSMTTVSAVIFLYSAKLRLASVAVINMEDAGDTAAAAAMSVLIVGTNLLVRLLFILVSRRIRRKTDAWARREEK